MPALHFSGIAGMWFYLTLLLVPAGAAVATHLDPPRRAALYGLLAALLTIAIGFRYQVGCDWNTYALSFVRTQNATSLAEALTLHSPGYMLVNWLAARAGLSIAAANTFCALVLVVGMFAFCTDQSKPWLAFLICIPVLIMIAGLSGTRQATAVGFFLFALHLHLKQHGLGRILALLIVAATFHATVLLMIPLMLLMRRDVPARAGVILLLTGLVGLAGPMLASFLPPFSTVLVSYPSSSGAWFRAVPTVIAILGYAIVRGRTDMPARESSMLFWLAAFSLFCLSVGFTSTTIMDRLGWYAIPFQIAALTRLASLARSPVEGLVLSSALASPFVVLLLGWLSQGTTASCLKPYRSYLTQPTLLLGADAAKSYRNTGVNDPWATLYNPVREVPD